MCGIAQTQPADLQACSDTHLWPRPCGLTGMHVLTVSFCGCADTVLTMCCSVLQLMRCLAPCQGAAAACRLLTWLGSLMGQHLRRHPSIKAAAAGAQRQLELSWPLSAAARGLQQGAAIGLLRPLAESMGGGHVIVGLWL
jgi:hypothetical protein